MNKKTQTIVGVLVVAGLGYWAYTKYGKKKSFSNFSARRRTSGLESPTQNLCGENCNGGRCYVPVYDASGNVSYQPHSCSGTIGSQIGGVLGS